MSFKFKFCQILSAISAGPVVSTAAGVAEPVRGLQVQVWTIAKMRWILWRLSALVIAAVLTPDPARKTKPTDCRKLWQVHNLYTKKICLYRIASESNHINDVVNNHNNVHYCV